MSRTLAAVLLLVTSPAYADLGDEYVSAGAYIAYGTRGLVLGVEATGVPSIPFGGAAGADIAISSRGAVQGRVYAQGQVSFVAGAGVGPSILFGHTNDIALQIDVFAAAGMLNDDGPEPWNYVLGFYRLGLSLINDTPATHEGGAMVKAMWAPNGVKDGAFIATH